MISRLITISLFITLVFQILFIGCGKKENFDVTAYKKEIEEWRTKRVERLKSENGWLTICGLFWLKEGENKFGTDSSNVIILPSGKAPKFAGSIFLKDSILRLQAQPRANIKYKDSVVTSMIIKSDADGNPTVLNLGSLNFYVIKRGEQIGVRVKDKDNPSRLNFKGLEYFPTDPIWRFEAKFEPYNPPKVIQIVNVLNKVSNDTCPGAIAFEFDGKMFRLDALREGKEFFIIFADETSGKETYGMGRFLSADLPDSNNTVILDFNKAYNPPCAFTVFATCPTPPKQNRLALRIEAGEKTYADSHH